MQRGELLVHAGDRMQALFALDSEQPSDLGRATIDLIERLQTACDLNGAELVVFAVPAQFQVEDEVLGLVVEQSGVDIDRVGAPQQFLGAVCAERGIRYVDPLRRFREVAPSRDLYWTLNPHFNEAGNLEAAETLCTALLESAGP